MCWEAYLYVFVAEGSTRRDYAGWRPSATAYDVESGGDAAEAGVQWRC